MEESEGEGPGEDRVRHVHHELRRPGSAGGTFKRSLSSQQVRKGPPYPPYSNKYLDSVTRFICTTGERKKAGKSF